MTRDKLLHFIGGALITLMIGVLVAPFAGLLVAIVVGVGKELWDRLGNGTPEMLDALATILGGALIYGVLQYLEMIR